MNQTVLVTGANRGIGLELVRQYHHQGARVMAVCRQSSEGLDTLSEVQVISGIDLTDQDDLIRLSAALDGQALDVLINNAGLLIPSDLPSMEDQLQAYRQQFEINTLAPLRVTRALLPLLSWGSKVVMITSRMGSIADNTSGGQFAYRISKAGLNAGAVSLAHELKPQGIAVGLLHPGFVRTEMTGLRGDVEPNEAASGLIARIEGMNLENTGQFWHANGQSLPW